MPVIRPARLTLNDTNTPWSKDYGDVYHSDGGARQQAQHVFLRGNGLPERWEKPGRFVIIETGFGLGLNFLETWAAFRSIAPAGSFLHFISVEKHPFTAQDLAQAHKLAGMDDELSHRLLQQWPPLISGLNRLEFEDERVTLTLGFGEASDLLGSLSATADAIYLDGFSPARNPDLWSDEIFRLLAQHSSETTTLATWSVSGLVRNGLTKAGFAVEKATGFGDKREMLKARYRGRRQDIKPAQAEKKAIVVGAGLAGTGIAERLASRGWQVQILEAQARTAQGASGNLAGAFRPLPSKDDNYISRITRAGFLYGLRHLARLRDSSCSVLWDSCGVLHLARNPEQERRQRDVVSALQWPETFLTSVTAQEATRIAGHTAAFGGWWFPGGGWIQPSSLCEANISNPLVNVSTDVSVEKIEKEGEEWAAYDSNGHLLGKASTLILANAVDAKRLADAGWLPLQAVRGQVSHLPMAQLAPLHVVVCGQGYITPGIGGHAALGASFVTDDFDLTLREDEHLENLAKLNQMLPGSTANTLSQQLEGRVSHRPVTSDRLPIVGAVPCLHERPNASPASYNLDTLPRSDGLWLITGFGARGLVWSSLCAEMLASRICNEPLPLEKELVEAMDPGRFVLKPVKQALTSGTRSA